MAKARLATQDFAKATEKSATKHKADWDKIGKASLVTGGAIAAVGVAGIKAFADFDKSMSRAQAGTMATGASLKALRDAAIDAGAKTQFSATEAADAITAMGKAGVSTKDILGGGLSGALSLAAAGELDVSQAAEIAATAMTQFGLAGKELPHVADLLAAGAGKAQGSVADLAGALKYVGPVSHGLGVSLEETTGVLAEFASQGIIGEQAGTSLRGMMLALTSPSKAAAKEMDALGINVYDASGHFVGMDGAAGELQSKLGGLDEASRNAALGVLFGNEQITAARVLYDGGAKSVQDWTKKVNDTGFAARQAAMLTNNLSGDLERLGGSLNKVLVENGSAANGALRSLTKTTDDLVKSFGELPGPVQAGLVKVGAAGAAALLTGGAIMVLIPKVVAAKAAFAELGVTSGKVSGGLSSLGKGAGVAALAFAGLEGINFLEHMNDYSGDTDKLTTSMRNLGTEVMTTGLLAGGGKGLGDFRLQSEKLFNPSVLDRGDKFNKYIENSLGILPLLGSATENATDAIGKYDQSLASLASGGSGDQAAAMFEVLSGILVKDGASAKEAADKFPAYSQAIAEAASQQKAAAVGGDVFAETQRRVTASTEKAVVVTKEAADAADKWRTSLMDLDGAFVDPLDAYTTLLDEKNKAEQATAQATADATKSGKDSWEDYAEQVDVPMSEYLRSLEKQVAAQSDWETNMLRLSSRVSQGTLDELAKMGPAGAPLVAQLVTASDGELKKMEKLFRARSDNATGAIADNLIAAGPVLTALAAKAGQKTADGYARKLAAGTATVAEIVKKYGLVIDEYVPEAKTTRFGTPGIDNSIEHVKKLRDAILDIKDRKVTVSVATMQGTLNKIQAGGTGRGVATGGYIAGPGGPTSDDIPAWLSNGEYVVKASSVAKYGTTMLDMLNAGAYAAGGRVSRNNAAALATARTPLTPAGRLQRVSFRHLIGATA